MTDTRAGDYRLALEAATELLAKCFCEQAGCTDAGAVEAAKRVTKVADVFVAWMRRLTSVTLTLVAIEEIDGSATFPPIPGAAVTDIDSSQRARYDVTAKDDRGFAADYALGARASDPAVVTVEYLNVGDEGNTSNGTDAEIDQVLATFAGTFGTSTVEVFDPADDTVVLAADTVVANPGAVASASLGTPVIEEIPEPTP